jgi:thiamine biosynthesis lipoprotein
MDTVISIKAYGETGEAAVNAAAERLTELERLFSVTDSASDISAVNARGSADVSDDTAYVVSEALRYCKETDGALDITVYPVLREWGFTTGNYRVPSDSEIDAALTKTGYADVTVSGSTISVPDGYMIDLGSCAKGYAGDELIKTMSQYGVTSALVNLGGNVRALGTKPDGSGFTVGIADPFSPNELTATVKIRDCSVVTSGGYQRFFTDDDGRKYIHIIDPSDGKPADSGLASVTVIGGDGLECDALSTALFVMGKEKAISYWRVHDGFDVVLISDEGDITITEGISDAFNVPGNRKFDIIRRNNEQ